MVPNLPAESPSIRPRTGETSPNGASPPRTDALQFKQFTNINRERRLLHPDAHNTARRLHRAESVARLLDAQYRIPFTPIRFGLDGLIGLIPGIGDTATMIVGLYIVYEAWRSGVNDATLAHMLFNIAIDTLLGAIPVLGDVFDIWFKANLRNIELFESALAAAPHPAR